MKGNIKRELHSKTREELKTAIKTIRGELVQMVVRKSSNKEKNVHTQKTKRKDLARLMTVLRKKETENA